MSKPADDSPPLAEELPALASDVAYEVNQFFHSVRRSSELAFEATQINAERNAHVEAMLIHARCLVDFFNAKPRKDDVVVTQYIPDWSVVDDGGEALSWLEANLGRYIDKRVAHLTAHRRRVSKDDEAQLVEDVIRRMVGLIERFRSRLDSQGRVLFFGPQSDSTE